MFIKDEIVGRAVNILIAFAKSPQMSSDFVDTARSILHLATEIPEIADRLDLIEIRKALQGWSLEGESSEIAFHRLMREHRETRDALERRRPTTLRETLRDWQDVDVALYYLGVAYGLWPDTPRTFAVDVKGIVNSNNEVCNWLYLQLEQMQTFGVVEQHPTDSHKWRWNPNTPPTWLGPSEPNQV
jgi:hypothetical protein